MAIQELHSTKPILTRLAPTSVVTGYTWKRWFIVALALLILCLRLPDYFAHPQFWAEDGLAWLQARSYGFDSLTMQMAGYQLAVMHVVALIAQIFPLSAAPAVYFYSTVAITLAMVWLVMSPRFDIPFQSLAALAIVTSYQGIYALGGIANLQWILPVGAFAVIFMRPSTSLLVGAAEIIFLMLVSLTGPFSIFLAPVLFLRLIAFKYLRIPRQVTFFIVVGIGALVQATSMLVNKEAALTSGEHVIPTLSMIVNMPLHQLFTPLGSHLFSGIIGVAATLVIATGIGRLAFLEPYRAEKISMILFCALLIAASIVKSGIDLNPSYGLRYFYIPSAFAIWFILFSTRLLPFPTGVAAVAAGFQFLTAVLSFNTGSIHGDFHWRWWATAIETGLPVTFPIAPEPWQINVPASMGTLSSLNSWMGQSIGLVAKISDQTCGGSASIESFIEPDFRNVPGSNTYRSPTPRWRLKGEISSNANLTVVTDQDSRVNGFGFVTGNEQAGKKTLDRHHPERARR